MRKTLWFTDAQDQLLKAITEAMTQDGVIEKRADVDQPSESAAVRWLIEQEAKRRGLITPS